MNHSVFETTESFREEFVPTMTGGLFSRIKLQMQPHSCTLNEYCHLSSLSVGAGCRRLDAVGHSPFSVRPGVASARRTTLLNACPHLQGGALAN